MAFAIGYLVANARFSGDADIGRSMKFHGHVEEPAKKVEVATASENGVEAASRELDQSSTSPGSTKPAEIVDQSSTSSGSIEPAEFGQVDMSKQDCSKFPSQHGEDRFLYHSFWSLPKPVTNGFYLELGALDGVWMSNSYWFDNCLGWKGVLIEAQPTAVTKLLKNRPHATILDEAVCAEEGEIDFVGTDNGVSGDVSQMPDAFIRDHHRGWEHGRDEVHKVKCGPLSKKLAKLGITHIDFWTLDVEGAEWSVLSTFDWDAVSIHVLVIENDKNEAVEKPRRHELLKSKNFELRGTLVNNELWVNNDNARPGVKERAVMWDGSDYLSNGAPHGT